MSEIAIEYAEGFWPILLCFSARLPTFLLLGQAASPKINH
jgi:hypothetical protein